MERLDHFESSYDGAPETHLSDLQDHNSGAEINNDSKRRELFIWTPGNILSTQTSKNIHTEGKYFFVSWKILSQLKIVADLDNMMLQKTDGFCSRRIITTHDNFQTNRIIFSPVRNEKPKVPSPFSATVYLGCFQSYQKTLN